MTKEVELGKWKEFAKNGLDVLGNRGSFDALGQQETPESKVVVAYSTRLGKTALSVTTLKQKEDDSRLLEKYDLTKYRLRPKGYDFPSDVLPFIPSKVSNYVDRGERYLEKLARALHLFKQAALIGPSGTGKTHVVYALGEAMSLPIWEVNCGVQTSAGDLFGKFIGLGKENWVDGPIVSWAKFGGILYLDEANMMKQLSHLDKEISLSNKLLIELASSERLLGQRIDSLRVSIAYEQQMLAYQQKRLAARVRQMYMRGPNYDLEVVLASPNVMEASRRYKFLQMVAQRDANLVQEVRNRKLELERERAALTEAMADVVTLKATRFEEDKTLQNSRKARVSMLKSLRSEKSQHAQAIDELQKSEEQLKDLIGQLEDRRLSGTDGLSLPPGDFAKLKGKMMRPVNGKITKKFGQEKHPKFGTVTFNNGVNIRAPAGAPIRAVATGKVEFVDWISGYGNCIILNHGGGYYTLYAHTAEIFVNPGQIVPQNDVIAEVGDSGSLNGYECHFEIRKSKKALDPLKWFAKR